MADAVPIAIAAAELGISESTLRRWLADGCPVARAGKRGGRGCATLYDVRAIRVWRDATNADARLLAIAGELPALVASAVEQSFNETDIGIDKRKLGGVFAGTWFLVSAALLDRLREDVPDVAELSEVPASIQRLRRLAAR